MFMAANSPVGPDLLCFCRDLVTIETSGMYLKICSWPEEENHSQPAAFEMEPAWVTRGVQA